MVNEITNEGTSSNLTEMYTSKGETAKVLNREVAKSVATSESGGSKQLKPDKKKSRNNKPVTTPSPSCRSFKTNSGDSLTGKFLKQVWRSVQSQQM